MGWDRLTNGDLLTAPEQGGFDVFVTADRNIRYQQNLAGRQISIIELSTGHRDTIRDNSSGIISSPLSRQRMQVATSWFPCPDHRGVADGHIPQISTMHPLPRHVNLVADITG
jgi:hypothetical protein